MVDPLLAALIETWTLYSGGTVIIMARVYCRWRMVGFYNFKPDDYMVIWAWVSAECFAQTKGTLYTVLRALPLLAIRQRPFR